MIYLTNGNMPLNAAYADDIVQEDNSTYQLSFRFPTSDTLWEQLKEETFLTADDLHGEQDFVIFEVEKKHGYIQVYANQVFTLLNNYVVNPISLDRATGSTALSRFAGSITRDNPFSFFSDIEDRHTFNIGSKNAMEAFAKDKHSIIGQWGGDLVRHGYQVRLLKNGGSENESLFMYKKNLSSYQHKTSTKSLKTRITFKTTIKGEGEKAPDRTFTVTIDSPLINKYSQIYEDVIEVNDEDVKDEASLRKYGEQYFKTSLCDMMEDSLELEVVGQSDVPVQIYDIVSLFYEIYNLDVRKKITKYTYSPMAKKLKSIGFGQFQSGLANAIGNAVSDVVKGEAQQLQSDFGRQLARELKNADLAFDRKTEELKNEFEDGLNATRAKAEEVKRELSDTIDQRFNSFDNGPLQEVKRRAEEALRNAGASTLLAQEAKRIGLDSVAKLEEFKRQATSAQTALLGDLDVLKRTIANDIRPKQVQAEAEISKQVEALVQTKKELAGVKSAQSTFEQSTTRRLSELTNLANGKASKSELTQTADELASKIASVQIAHKNQEDRVSVVESNFRQRADALDAGVSRLTEGLRTKADISSLNVTAENIRQSVKSLETSTQNKLDQKLSQAEFEVQAGSIRQEILNATKDKADKTLVVAEAGKLREEFSKMKVGSRNYAEDYDFSRGLWLYSQGDNSPQDWTISNGEYNVKGTTNTWKQMQINSKEGSRSSWKSSTALLDLELGETYTLSFQAMCYSGSPRVWVSLRANRTVPGNTEVISGKFTLTSAWQTYQVTIPALTKPDNFDFWRIILGYGGIGHVAFRKVELTRSSTRIDAGPAPEDGKTDLVVAKSEFEKTAEGLSSKLATVETYVSQDGQRQEALRRYTREESAKQATSVRELVTRDYVGKSAYQEDVRGIERRLEAITNPQNGSIATQIAKYKTVVDGRFADITSMISGKANQTDFQRVRETSQLYERILGNSENGIADKVARMALTNRLFQVEVSKAVRGGRNYIRGIKEMRVASGSWDSGTFRGSGSGSIRTIDVLDSPVPGFNKAVRIISSDPKGQIGIAQDGFEIMSGTYTMSVWIKGSAGQRVRLQNYWWSDDSTGISPEFILKDDKWTYLTFSSERKKAGKLSIGYVYLVNGAKGSYIDVLAPQLEEGSIATSARPAIEDTDEAVKTVQTQLDGSWAVQNLTSAGALVSGLNLGANGHNRFDGKLTHITGETLIDKAVIKSAMVDKLKTANFEAGSVTTVVLDAEAVTAEKLKVDQAFFNKLVANEAYLSQLFAKQAFINRVQSVTLDASQIKTGVLTGGRIQGGTITGSSISGGTITGGTITGSSISGATLTGHTKIKLGTYGSFDTVNGGLQINVPRTVNSKDGLGVQFIGSYGRGDNVPYGLFIYKDPDITVGNISSKSDDFLLTVEGYINAKGIGWLRTGNGSVNGKLTATLGLWNSSNVSLAFGGPDNDIYYSYNGTAYGLWPIVNKHFSDSRLKENIVDCKHKALDYIQQFQFKEYDWKKQEDRPRQAHTKIGLIAQEVQAVDPTLVYENGDTLNLDNLRLTNIALKAIQELALENQTLTQRLENLENERRTA